jgi:hypothetical protein
MRIGPCTAKLTLLLTFTISGGTALAQMGAPGYQGPAQAVYMAPSGQSNPYSYGGNNSGVMPASYCGDDCGRSCSCGSGDYGCSGGCGGDDAGCYADDCYGDDGGCDDGGSYDGCGRGGLIGGLHHLFHRGIGAPGTNPPFPQDVENYSLMCPERTEQCGPHYWDCRMEAVSMIRDKTFSPDITFSRLGENGPFVLFSNQLDYDYQTGFRVMGRYDLCPLTVLEFGYMGIYNINTAASTTDPNPVNPNTGNLFSLFSNFGTNPATVAVPQGPMPDTERSVTQSLFLTSNLQNVEMNVRRYWVGFSPCVSGTCLAGFRYTRLYEDFIFDTRGEAHGNYNTRAENNLAGFQTGGDVWVHIWQGFRVGAEGKVGVADNHYNVQNTFTDTSGTAVFTHERFDKDIPALVTDASLDAVCDVCPSWSIRAGYEILFLNSVALAGDNFNQASPYAIAGQAPRVPFVADQSSAFYHGFHLGFEYIW